MKVVVGNGRVLHVSGGMVLLTWQEEKEEAHQ